MPLSVFPFLCAVMTLHEGFPAFLGKRLWKTGPGRQLEEHKRGDLCRCGLKMGVENLTDPIALDRVFCLRGMPYS